MTQILFKRGLETNRTQSTPGAGEPLITTDNKELWVGDGSTQGGWPVGTIKSTGSIDSGDVALFFGTTGKVLNGTSKAAFLNGYATETYVTTKINSTTPSIKVNSAAVSDKASNADQLGGLSSSSYVKTANVTGNYQEDNTAKVVSARGIKAFFDAITKTITDGLGLKINKSDIAQDVNSTSQTKVASSYAVKKVNDIVTTLQSSVTSQGNTLTSVNNQVQTNKQHLSFLPGKVTRGTTNPSGGSDGDVYIQYK